VGAIEQNRADGFRDGRAAGFAGHDDVAPETDEVLVKAADLGGFSASLDAFERDEETF
jgi:hypothetical protein